MTDPAFLPCPSDPCPAAVGDLDFCPICHEGYFQQHEVLVTLCNHRYHEYCITEWLKTRDIKKRTCAMCCRMAVPLVRESSSLFDDDKETNPFVESAILRSVRLGQRDFIAPLLVSNPGIANQRFLSVVSGDKVPLLYIAAQEGHLELATDLLAAGARVDAPLKNGSTPLFIAVQKGHRELVAVLLAAGAKVNASRNDGSTPLFMATQLGYLDLVAKLLAAGAWVNAPRENGATPLHMAAQLGYLDLAAKLLAAGALVDALRKDGTTPLYTAALFGHRELVANLLTAGADPEKKWRMFSPRIRKSAIQAARKNHHDDIAQMLTDWIRSRRRKITASTKLRNYAKAR